MFAFCKSHPVKFITFVQGCFFQEFTLACMQQQHHLVNGNYSWRGKQAMRADQTQGPAFFHGNQIL